MAWVAGKAHLAVQHSGPAREIAMSDFIPALGLYVVTAAVSIALALHWVV